MRLDTGSKLRQFDNVSQYLMCAFRQSDKETTHLKYGAVDGARQREAARSWGVQKQGQLFCSDDSTSRRDICASSAPPRALKSGVGVPVAKHDGEDRLEEVHLVLAAALLVALALLALALPWRHVPAVTELESRIRVITMHGDMSLQSRVGVRITD